MKINRLAAVILLFLCVSTALLLKNNFDQHASYSLPTFIQPTPLSPPLITSNQKALKFKILTFKEVRLNHPLYKQLQTIFQGSVNFPKKLRPTDQVSIISDKLGNIVSVTFPLRNHHRVQAIRYTDRQGHTDYYTPNGLSLRKFKFLRNPVKFIRISDIFTTHRLHPILHITRPHYGIDYAATRGTPVHAVSDGTISFSGGYGNYGKTVVINHDPEYQTLYAHLDKISAHLQPGQHVSQGQVIGYVGSSGLATGYHLHFGLYKFGKAVDPALILSEQNSHLAIAEKDFADFHAKIQPLLIKNG